MTDLVSCKSGGGWRNHVRADCSGRKWCAVCHARPRRRQWRGRADCSACRAGRRAQVHGGATVAVESCRSLSAQCSAKVQVVAQVVAHRIEKWSRFHAHRVRCAGSEHMMKALVKPVVKPCRHVLHIGSLPYLGLLLPPWHTTLLLLIPHPTAYSVLHAACRCSRCCCNHSIFSCCSCLRSTVCSSAACRFCAIRSS